MLLGRLIGQKRMREVLHEQTLFRYGNFRRVRRWIRGWHPKEGTLINGWTGKETVIEQDLVRPYWIFEMKGGENERKRIINRH